MFVSLLVAVRRGGVSRRSHNDGGSSGPAMTDGLTDGRIQRFRIGLWALHCSSSVRPHDWHTAPTARRSDTLAEGAANMSIVGNNRVGIPIVVLHDAEGAIVEVETKKGELIRGMLFEAEDQMNLYIKNAIIVDTNGVKRRTNQLYVRGCEIVFIVLPEMLQHAPMFKRYECLWRFV